MTAKEFDKRMGRIDARLDRVSRQLGGLGNNFGLLTEGLASPSLERILCERFGVEFMARRVGLRKGGETLDLDVLAYANGARNAAIIGEVKTRLDQRAVDQLLDHLRDFPRFAPEHREKELYGLIAGVEVDEQAARRALKEGLLVARISDDVMQLKVPAGFRPRSFKASN